MLKYTIKYFKSVGLYEEATGSEDCSFEGGKVVQYPEVSGKIRDMLSIPGGTSYNGDISRQDSAVISSLLGAGYNPADTYATFSASPRGRDAERRKNGHFEDYMKRTIEKASAYIHRNGHGNRIVNVDFSEPKPEPKPKPNGHAAPTNDRKIEVNFSTVRDRSAGSGMIISMCNEIEIVKTNWVWPGFIPAGKLTLLAGDPGMGKSTIVNDLIARISRGMPLPTGQRCITGVSLIASAEDSADDTITPRLLACGANLNKVGVIREIIEDGETRYLSFPRDLNMIRQKVIAKRCRLLVIDPLNAFLSKGTDSHKDQDIRAILHPIEMIAEETGVAILVVAHMNKRGEDGNALYRVGGSIGFIGAARSVLAVALLPDGSRVLHSLKSNLSIRPMAVKYEISQTRKIKTKKNTWLGDDVVNSTSIRWLGEVEYNPNSKEAVPEAQAIEEAISYLRQTLSGGQIESDAIAAECKEVGITKHSIREARHKLGVVVIKRNGQWFWQLPG